MYISQYVSHAPDDIKRMMKHVGRCLTSSHTLAASQKECFVDVRIATAYRFLMLVYFLQNVSVFPHFNKCCFKNILHYGYLYLVCS